MNDASDVRAATAAHRYRHQRNAIHQIVGSNTYGSGGGRRSEAISSGSALFSFAAPLRLLCAPGQTSGPPKISGEDYCFPRGSDEAVSIEREKIPRRRSPKKLSWLPYLVDLERRVDWCGLLDLANHAAQGLSQHILRDVAEWLCVCDL
jgi:hypothetical protein